ncbi:hypothetical protein NSU08_02915 [Paenibacillus sp. FSL H7-0331]|uniref:hypothetical protein n=1 Tax=Paenibacillus sp. FSL H7-0331 TaxID=1920421 RepID=UPI0030FC180F
MSDRPETIDTEINDFLGNQDRKEFRLVDIKYRIIEKDGKVYSYALVIGEYTWD